MHLHQQVKREQQVQLALNDVLNKSNNHCYLRYCKHGPTTAINTFDATALLIFRLLLSILYNR